MATPPELADKRKIARVIALAPRVSFSFPYRLDQIGTPANVYLKRGEHVDFDEDDITEIDGTINNLVESKAILVIRIGYDHDAEEVGYTPANPGAWAPIPPVNVQQALDSLVGCCGNWAIKTVSGHYTLTLADTFLKVNSVAPAIITLPPLTKGKLFVVKRMGTGLVTVVGLIDGAPQITIDYPYQSLSFIGDTTEWSLW